MQNPKIATLMVSFEQKNFGKTVSAEDYVTYYNVDLKEEESSELKVAYVKASVKKTENLGNFNSLTYVSEISLPFLYDVTDPESKDNKFRMEHATKIRDSFLSEDLAEVRELGISNYKDDNGLLNE
mgnify:FL=1